LVLWYVLVSLLHAFWDASGGIAALLVLLLTANSMQQELVAVGRVPGPTPQQVTLFTLLNWSLLALNGIIGISLLIGRWRTGDPLRAATCRCSSPIRSGSCGSWHGGSARPGAGCAGHRHTSPS